MRYSEVEHLKGEFSGQNTANEDRKEKGMESKRGGWTAFPFITGTELGLSLAAGGWSSNLLVYLITKFNLKSIHATQISNTVAGCNNLFPVAGAIIADSYCGSFAVITLFSFISLLGTILMTLTASINSLHPPPCLNAPNTCETSSEIQLTALFTGITLASLGSAGTSFTVATMGADQFENPNDQNIFFNWYFIILYACATVSSTVIVFLQDNVSWGLGFGVCVAANAIGLTVFILGKRYYRHIKPKGSPFMSIARVVIAAIRKRKVIGTKGYFYGDDAGISRINSGPTDSFSFLNNAALKSEGYTESDALIEKKSWNLCTVQEVEDLKTLIKIIPIWSTSILLSTTIGIFISLTVLQALTMDRHLTTSFSIPAASILVFNILATSISLSILDRLILPRWKKLTGHLLTPLQQIGIGHVINILALVGSALVENQRLQVVKSHHLMGDGSVVPMSAMWLVVPLVIIGIAGAFHFPGQVAFYYQEFPTSLRSTSTAMMSLIIAIGFYLSSAIVGLVRRSTRWLPDNINDGRVDYVFWIMAGIGVVNFGYYLICANLFNYHDAEKDGGDSGPH